MLWNTEIMHADADIVGCHRFQKLVAADAAAGFIC